MAKATSSPTLADMLAEPITGDAKVQFHRKARALLKRLATVLELPKDSFEIRTNRGGPAVSGEVMLQGERVHVQITQSGMGRDHDVLSRPSRRCWRARMTSRRRTQAWHACRERLDAIEAWPEENVVHSDEVRARAARWLPPGMGVQADPVADADEIGASEADAAEEAVPAAAA